MFYSAKACVPKLVLCVLLSTLHCIDVSTVAINRFIIIIIIIIIIWIDNEQRARNCTG